MLPPVLFRKPQFTPSRSTSFPIDVEILEEKIPASVKATRVVKVNTINGKIRWCGRAWVCFRQAQFI